MQKKSLSGLSVLDLLYDSPPYASYFRRLPVLETRDLILRPLNKADADDLFAWQSDAEVARYVLWQPHQSVAESREYVRGMRSLYRRGLPSSWGIVERASGRVVGSVGVMWISAENRSAEVGYSLARPYWNRGYMTQALSAVLRSLFEDLDLNRVEGQCDIRNPASGRVMEKCGMRLEGVLRGRIFNKGEFIDTALYAAVRNR